MEELPLVPFLRIVDHLSISEILNLKLVNRRLNALVSERVQIEDYLVISNDDFGPENKRWFYTRDQVHLAHLMKSNGFERTDLLLQKPIVSDRLKRLYLYKCFIDVESLNRLEALTQLDINKTEIRSAHCDVVTLDELEVFNFTHSNVQPWMITLDTPKLTKLKMDSRTFQLAYPKSIKYVEANEFHHCRTFVGSLVNLEHLYCRKLVALHVEHMMARLLKLKCIHLNGDRSALESLLQQREDHERNDLKIYFHNLEWNDRMSDELLGQLEHDSGQVLNARAIEAYVRNYALLADHCPFVGAINYCEIEPFLHRIPSEHFWTRFVSVYSLLAKGNVMHVNELIKELRNCPTIVWLDLTASIDQSFYDVTLPALCPNIYSLTIWDSDAADRPAIRPLDCDFVLRLNNVNYFSIKQRLPLAFVRAFMEQHRIVVCLKYVHRSDLVIKLRHRRSRDYELVINEKSTSHATLDDLFGLLEQLE